MELMEKQGYKQTEVGLIPEDWNVYRFEDLGDTIIGLTYKPVDVNITGKLVHRSSNIQNNKLAYHDNVYVTCHIPEKLILRKDDILICVRNGSRDLIGKSAIIQGISIGETFGAFMSVFRPRIYPPLVYQYFISNIVQSQINASLGATINQITNKTLNSFITVFPTNLKEQKAIATALSEVDELINTLDKLIAKKKAIKQGAIQQLLTPPHKGGKRLEGFSGEWEEKKLGELCDISGAGVDKKIIEGEQTVRLLNYMDVMKRDYVYNNELNHVVTAPHFKTISCNVIKGDIFLTPSSELRTDIGISAIAMEDMDGVVYSYHVYRLRYNIEIDKLFGLYLLKTKKFLAQPEKMCEGSGKRYVVSMSKFKNMIVYLPKEVNEQNAISNMIYDIDLEIKQLENKKAKYQNIKQGMMQELLTGKTRLI